MKISSEYTKRYLPQSRLDFPLYLKGSHLNGLGVEIGVQRGEYSEEILKNSNLTRLYSIDPWLQFNDINDTSNCTQSEHDDNYLQTVILLKKFKSRSVILRMQSIDAVLHFPDNTLDFVHIDGNHTYQAVKQDLIDWWPKMRKNGLFSGHDYLNGIYHNTEFGVKQAVDEFVAKNNLICNIIDFTYPTWYIIK